MRHRPTPQRSTDGGRGNPIQVELLQEKAATLKRLLERLERALSALEIHDGKGAPTSAHNGVSRGGAPACGTPPATGGAPASAPPAVGRVRVGNAARSPGRVRIWNAPAARATAASASETTHVGAGPSAPRIHPSPPPGLRAQLLADAGEALFLYVAQRDVLGLSGTEAVLDELGVPREVRLRMAPRSVLLAVDPEEP